MRPAFSIICFTVLSGAGYGALFLLGLGIALGALPTQLELPHVWARFAAAGPLVADPRLALALALAAAALLATIGLLFSLGHLGKPLRAWRALSQWRSSWLSREGVASLATYMPLLALFVLLLAPRHTHPASMSVALRACGALLCAGAAATVVCTAHIYASLQPVRAWHDRHVVPAYLLLGLQSGASWLVALAAIGIPARRWSVPLWLVNALLLAPCCAWIKRRYWHSIDAGAGTPRGSAGERDTDGLPTPAPALLQGGGQPRRAGALGHVVRVREQDAHGRGDLVVGHGDHVLGFAPHDRQGLFIGDPAGHSVGQHGGAAQGQGHTVGRPPAAAPDVGG